MPLSEPLGSYAVCYLLAAFLIFSFRKKMKISARDTLGLLGIAGVIGLIIRMSIQFIGVVWTVMLVIFFLLSFGVAVLMVRNKEDRELEGQLGHVLKPPLSILPERLDREEPVEMPRPAREEVVSIWSTSPVVEEKEASPPQAAHCEDWTAAGIEAAAAVDGMAALDDADLREEPEPDEHMPAQDMQLLVSDGQQSDMEEAAALPDYDGGQDVDVPQPAEEEQPEQTESDEDRPPFPEQSDAEGVRNAGMRTEQDLAAVQQHYASALEALQKRNYPHALSELASALSYEPPLTAKVMMTKDVVRILNELGLYHRSIATLQNLLAQLPEQVSKIEMEITQQIKYIEIVIELLQEQGKNNLPWSLIPSNLRQRADEQISQYIENQAINHS